MRPTLSNFSNDSYHSYFSYLSYFSTSAKKIFFAALACLLLLTAAMGCSPQEQVRQMSGNTWGTTYHITYTSASDLSADVLTQMQLVDSTLSMFNPASEVSRINVCPSPTTVSDAFREVFEISSMVNARSGGRFDPTVAPLVDFWGFGRKAAPDTLAPDTLRIHEILMRVGISDCKISENNLLQKKHPQTEFDFSAVAKGYGVDCIAEVLARARVQNYMVEVGGEIALAGKNPRGEPWHIQIDAPLVSDTLTHSRLTILTLTDCCLATSGNYRRWQNTSAGRVGHTISPISGLPVTSPTLSATVIAPSCALADALATACMAMPTRDALAMIDAMPGVSAMLVLAPEKSDSEHFRIITSANWPSKP